MINIDNIFNINTTEDFEQAALEVFRYQAACCEPYKRYIALLGIDPQKVKYVAEIPFLPIRFFKTQNIYASTKAADVVFTSSGTTRMETSRHAVADIGIYEESFNRGFRHFYGNPSKLVLLALLPAYLERQGSSLIYMVDSFIKQSITPASGFFLHNHHELYEQLHILSQMQQPTLLIGVSFALLDFVEKFHLQFPNLIVMETGGMKGRRKELPREELHQLLCDGFGVATIHSEYGMTELLSQAYSAGNGKFFAPPWMQIVIRDVQDPFTKAKEMTVGGINVIDLANVYSCSFIETQDLGRLFPDGSFEINGRFDNSDIRGCNLLVAE